MSLERWLSVLKTAVLTDGHAAKDEALEHAAASFAPGYSNTP